MSLVLSLWKLVKTMKFATCLQLTHKWMTHERSHEKHMLEAKESSARLYFMSHFTTGLTREWPAKLSAWMILSVTLIPFTHTIYTLIIHKTEKKAIQKKTLERFLQHTYLVRESYSFLVVSSPSLSNCYTLIGNLYPNTTHTYSECRKYFGT